MDYGKAKKSTEDIYNKLYQEKRNWFMITVILLVVNVLLVASVVATAMISKPYPWIVQVDEHGFEVAIGQAGSQNIDRRVVISRIGRFVKASRSIISDNKGQEAMIKWAYAAVANNSKAHKTLDDDQKSLRPYFRGQRGESVEVVINNILPKSDKTYQVNWTEKTFGGSGTTDIDYTGVFTVEISPLKDGKDIINNPLGIFITEYTFAPNYIQQ